jgi:hypothetical protein
MKDLTLAVTGLLSVEEVGLDSATLGAPYTVSANQL